ncbi:hypothetical protein [Streptococcus suis]|uniref:DUF7657 domain-containing protein n=1 Tax=Streptococcus suis TaxID=1307 RepID=UPI00040D509C|nr:hypothetical protein [Streptococcus suis]
MNKGIRTVVPPAIAIFLMTHWFFLGDYPIYQFKTNPHYFLILGLALILFIVSYRLLEKNKEFIFDKLYKYRYLLVLIIIIFGVFFEISGSSIGIWGDYLNSEELDKVLFGVDRAIRSDEFGTSTIWTFSQFSNSESLLPYFSQVVRGTKTDMFILLNQPVLALPIIFKPAQWGYLFLGINKGLSFAWLVRFFLMFMSLFEMLMLVLKRDKTLAFIGAALISYGPAVQWWSMGPAEVLTWGSLAVIIVYHYIQTNNYINRILLGLLLAWTATAYALVIYPAWQVPYLYVFISISIYFIVKNWKRMMFSWTKDTLIIISALVITITTLVGIFLVSSEAIQLTLQTAYPGARSSAGGGQEFFSFVTGYPFSIWYPTFGLAEERGMNVFYDFFPLGMILATYAWIKKRDSLLTILLLLNLFFICYMVAGIPNFLAKISLLSFTTTARIIPIFSFINILLVLRSLVGMKKDISQRTSRIVSFIMASLVIFFAYNSTSSYITNSLSVDGTSELRVSLYRWSVILISYFVLMYVFNAILSINKQKLLKVSLAIIFLSGVMVNPVRIGSDVIFKSNLVTNIKSITESDKESKWLVDVIGYPMTNLPLVAGAPTLNSTNAYPNLELWKSLDPLSLYNEIYNRYAHVMVEITNSEEVVFELLQPDVFKVFIPVSKLEEMDVKYIISIRDLSTFNTETVHFELQSTADNYLIYKIEKVQ